MRAVHPPTGSGVGTGADRDGKRPKARWRTLLVEPRRPVWVREHPNAHWMVIGAVCIGAFMGQLDTSIVSLAFPTLQHAFHASIAATAWVGLSYLVTLVGMVIAVGRLADMIGRKLLYTYGFLVFIAGSILCGLAPTLGLLDVFRVFQAIGAAMLQANSVAIIAQAIPRRMLGRAIGIQGAAQALGLALGPTIGGLLIAVGGWRLLFFVNVPAGLLGALLGCLFIPRSQELEPWSPFDLAGLSLFFPAVACGLAAISFGNDSGWGSPPILGLFAVSAALALGFVVREHRAAAPMLDLALFRRVTFSAAIASGMLSYVVLFGTLFIVPFFAERARHASTGKAGLELAVLPIALGLTAPFAGRLADRTGPRLPNLAGMGIAAMALICMALLAESTTSLLVELAALGFGLGSFLPSNNATIMASAPRSQSGMASGILNTTRGTGTALGLAVTSSVFAAIAGRSVSAPVDVARGYRASLLLLAGVAFAATVPAFVRRAAPEAEAHPHDT